MRRITRHSLIIAIAGACILSCSGPANQSTATYDIGLVETKKITLPVDENTYYLGKRIFQYEEDGKEFLFFGNFDKGTYEIILFEIANECVHKRIPLEKEGANGVPAIAGCKPFWDSKQFIAFQHNISRISILDGEGNVSKHYFTDPGDGRFIRCSEGWSYSYQPSFIKDSVVYLSSGTQKSEMKHHEWSTLPLFSLLDLRTGKIDQSRLCFPPIFDQDIKRVSGGHEFAYDYNYNQDRLVCSFYGYDSLMVTDDMQQVRWYDGKSRYLKSMRPQLKDAGDSRQLIKFRENPLYSRMMYDKYRDVYYRFAEMPYELQPDESPYEDPKSREFSVIIFDKDFRIIGETKFPGNKYFNKMSFVGRDGLYISENNLANPDFDEDKLVFACFKLEDLKGK